MSPGIWAYWNSARASYWTFFYQTWKVPSFIPCFRQNFFSLSAFPVCFHKLFTVMLAPLHICPASIARSSTFMQPAYHSTGPIIALTRISHRIPAASADSASATARIGKTPDCSMSIRLLRRFINLRPRSSALHALTTKFCEICWLSCIMFMFFTCRSPSGIESPSANYSSD